MPKSNGRASPINNTDTTNIPTIDDAALARARRWFRWDTVYALVKFHVALKKRKMTLVQVGLLPTALILTWIIIRVQLSTNGATESASDEIVAPSSMPIDLCTASGCIDFAFTPRFSKYGEFIERRLGEYTGVKGVKTRAYDSVEEILLDIGKGTTFKTIVVFSEWEMDWSEMPIYKTKKADSSAFSFTTQQCYELTVSGGEKVQYEIWTPNLIYGEYNTGGMLIRQAFVANSILWYHAEYESQEDLKPEFTTTFNMKEFPRTDYNGKEEPSATELRAHRADRRKSLELQWVLFLINVVVIVEAYIATAYFVRDKQALRHQGMTMMGVRTAELWVAWFLTEFALAFAATLLTCLIGYSMVFVLFIRTTPFFLIPSILFYKITMITFFAPYAALCGSPRKLFAALFIVLGASYWFAFILMTFGYFRSFTYGDFERFILSMFPYYLNGLSAEYVYTFIAGCDGFKTKFMGRDPGHMCGYHGGVLEHEFFERGQFYYSSSLDYWQGTSYSIYTQPGTTGDGHWTTTGSSRNVGRGFGSSTTSYYPYSSTSSYYSAYGGSDDPTPLMPYAILFLYIVPFIRDIALTLYVDHVTSSPSAPAKAKCFCCSWCSCCGGASNKRAHDSFEYEDYEELGDDCGLLTNTHPVAIRMHKLKKIYFDGYGCGSCKCGGSAEPVIAVNELSLTASVGSVLGILGQNGAGKTSAFSVLTGVTSGDEGIVVVGGLDVACDMDTIQPLLGVCPQHDTLFHELTPRDHLNLLAAVKGVSKEDIKGVVDEHLAAVNLTNVADDAIGTFSGGMRQRVAVACATLCNPPFIFLDEPTSGLDPVNRQAVWEIVNKAKAHSVVVLITHSMEEAELLSDRLAIMVEGRLAALGDPMKMKARFSAGYNLTFVCKSGKEKEVVKQLRRHVKRLKVTSSRGGSVQVSVPRHSGDDIPNLLFYAEEQIALGEYGSVSDWSLSFATLDEVFRAVTRGEEDRTNTLVMESRRGIHRPPPTKKADSKKNKKNKQKNNGKGVNRAEMESLLAEAYDNSSDERDDFCRIVEEFNCDRELIKDLIAFINTRQEEGSNPLFFDYREFEKAATKYETKGV